MKIRAALMLLFVLVGRMLSGQSDISRYCACLVDNKNEYAFEDLRARPERLTAALRETAQWRNIWARCTLSMREPFHLVTDLADRVTLYLEEPAGGGSRWENGKFVAPTERAAPFPDAFDLPAGADTGVVWLHFQNAYPLPRHAAPALLSFQKEAYAAWRQKESGARQSVLYGWGAAQGAMLAFMIFPLALFWLNRQRYYLYYIAYVILVAANDHIEFERFSHLDMWVSSRPALFTALLNLLQIAAIGFYVAFFREFLELKQRKPWLDKMLRYLIGYCVLVFAADFAVSVLGWGGRQNHLLYWLTRVPTAIAAVISVVAIMKWKDLDARFICLGVLSWMAGVSIAFAANGGAFPLDLLTGFFSNPYIFIHLGVLLELFFFSLALSYRNQQHILKRQQAEWALSDMQQTHQMEMERISRDLHDEVGSTLSSISILSDSTLQNLQSDMGQSRLSVISERARQVMDTMSDIIWSVNPRNDSMEQTLRRMKEFAVEILETRGAALHFEADDAVTSINLPMEQRKDFYLLFKEAVNNAAKYSGARDIWVSVGTENGRLRLVVRDNGSGFDAGRIKPGNGLWNMQRRAERMGGELKIESAPGEGTGIRLEAPVR